MSGCNKATARSVASGYITGYKPRSGEYFIRYKFVSCSPAIPINGSGWGNSHCMMLCDVASKIIIN